MEKIITHEYLINQNLLVVYEMLECLTNKLFIPNPYYKQLKNLTTSIGNSIFSFPENIDNLDYLGENTKIISFYQERCEKELKK